MMATLRRQISSAVAGHVAVGGTRSWGGNSVAGSAAEDGHPPVHFFVVMISE